MALKTVKVGFKAGPHGRGVKLSAKNLRSVENWLDDARALFRGGDEDRVKILAGPNKKQPRVALIGDIIVKIGKGKDAYFLVVKPETFAEMIKL